MKRKEENRIENVLNLSKNNSNKILNKQTNGFILVEEHK